jgi:hypothetical protein
MKKLIPIVLVAGLVWVGTTFYERSVADSKDLKPVGSYPLG